MVIRLQKLSRSNFIFPLFLMIIFVSVAVYFRTNELKLAADGKGDVNQEAIVKGDAIHVEAKEASASSVDDKARHQRDQRVHLAITVCGDRMQEAMVLLKSAALLAKAKLVFHIFAEKKLQSDFNRQLYDWPQTFKNRVEYHVYNISFPTSGNMDWAHLHRPCSAQRLFAADLLPDVDALLYLDSDLVFLTPVEEIWPIFSRFNASQMVASGAEGGPFYKNRKGFPYVGETGLNTGVLLMNLTRLRKYSWIEPCLSVYRQHRSKIVLGEQDMLNIYFTLQPEHLYMLPCEWNYRSDFCVQNALCQAAEETGVCLLHGNRWVWDNDKEPALKAVYTAMKQFDWNVNTTRQLEQDIQLKLKSVRPSACAHVKSRFTAQLHRYNNLSLAESHSPGAV